MPESHILGATNHHSQGNDGHRRAKEKVFTLLLLAFSEVCSHLSVGLVLSLFRAQERTIASATTKQQDSDGG
jgi:hypothetical protein